MPTGFQDAVVLIIGAGYGGLAAADTLVNSYNCQNVRILEASNRPGGRVHTIKENNVAIELGAQFIHARESQIYHIAEKLDNILEEDEDALADDVMATYLPGGRRVPQEVAFAFEKFARFADARMQQFQPLCDTNCVPSVAQYIMQCLESRENPEEVFLLEEVARLGVYFIPYLPTMMSYIEFRTNWDHSSETWLDVSVNSFRCYHEFPKEEAIRLGDGGYGKITDYLLKKLPDDCISYNSKVEKIIWDREVVSVELANGKALVADHVIITCSIGHLRANRESLFRPKLPTKKCQYIDSIGFGSVEKVILIFEEQFWPDDADSFFFSDNQIPKNEKARELKDAFYYFEILPNIDNGLIVWITGSDLKLFAEATDAEVIEAAKSQLGKYFGLPVVPEPLKIIRSSWTNNPFFVGTYSYYKTGVTIEECNVHDMIKPLSHVNNEGIEVPKVLFAGEATSEVHWGTVHGAYETGQREAERLFEFYARMLP